MAHIPGDFKNCEAYEEGWNIQACVRLPFYRRVDSTCTPAVGCRSRAVEHRLRLTKAWTNVVGRPDLASPDCPGEAMSYRRCRASISQRKIMAPPGFICAPAAQQLLQVLALCHLYWSPVQRYKASKPLSCRILSRCLNCHLKICRDRSKAIWIMLFNGMMELYVIGWSGISEADLCSFASENSCLSQHKPLATRRSWKIS